MQLPGVGKAGSVKIQSPRPLDVSFYRLSESFDANTILKN